MLTPEMQTLIACHRAGMVATANDDGTPSVSPKATFVIIDERTLAVGNIRSPGTVANLRKRPAVEVCFIDVLTRKAVRVAGRGEVVARASAPSSLTAVFLREWPDYVNHMKSYIVIDVTAAELILSPGYDLGFTEDQLRQHNLARLQGL